MNQPAGASERLYSGMVDCAVKTVRREGVLSLYNGFLPNFLRIGPWCAIMFTTYEQYRLFVKRNAWGAAA